MQNRSENRVFAVPSADGGRAVLRAVKERFATRLEPRSRREETLIDTFDWRVHREGGALAVVPAPHGVELVWRDAGGSTRFLLPLPEAPGFAGDLPDGIFRESLLRVCGIRRLLPAARVRLSVETLRVLDEREKTVARISVEAGSATEPDSRSRGGGLPRIVKLIAVRGYDRAAERLAEVLSELPDLQRAPASDLGRALAALGREPQDHDSVGTPLDPESPAGRAMGEVLLPLLEAMRRNEDGLRRELDTEFLHEFRVAVRRTRSALGQLKPVFDRARLKPFRRDFSWLGGVTGPARDLDVYVLALPHYRLALPESCRRDLDPLEAHLQTRRALAQKDLLTALDSDRYRRLVIGWEAFLDGLAEQEGPASSQRPIIEVASERIALAYRRVLVRGERLGSESDAEGFHDLRIDAKKLRYLLEIFASLYDARKLRRLVKELKRLQDSLGDMNDLVVQQASLRGFAAEMQREETADESTFDAIGRIVAEMEARHDRERKRFTKRFRRFADTDNRARMGRLLGNGDGGKS